MHTISIGRERLVTTEAVAAAVIGYALALHQAREADTVTIPIVLDGAHATASVFISANGHMVMLPSSTTETELPTAVTTVDELQRRRTRLQPVPVEADLDSNRADLAFPDFDAYL